jgi:hypothetical protein
MLVLNTPKSRLPGILGKWGVKIPWYIHHQGVILDTRELLILMNTVFKGTIILKINHKFLHLHRDT